MSLCLLAFILMLLKSRDLRQADVFLVKEDLQVLALEGVFLLLMAKGLAGRGFPAWAWPTAWRSARVVAALAALAVLITGLVGWRLVFSRYPLSLDEFFAVSDATTFHRGLFIAPVPAIWREYVPALQPEFGLQVPGHAVWSSDYLPLNAAFRGLLMAVGGAAWAGPLLSAFSVAMVYDIAKVLWPDRPDAAAVAAVFLASSSQLLFTAMTPYAMSAHLALNLTWLRLYQRDSGWSDGAALAVGWAACGLHQLVFHPLLVAPFILHAFASGRWRRAVVFTCGYAAIGLFWILYWPVMFHLMGLAAPQGKGGGVQAFAGHVLQLVSESDPLEAVRLMAENLIRFISWQNPLMAVLLFAGFVPALRTGGALRNMAAASILTLATVALVMPYQGLGWGYRYLHGLLGCACLIAAAAYVELTRSAWSPLLARNAIMLSLAASVLVLAPWRALQAHADAAPFARASQAISADTADFVVVNGGDVSGLVRNDPGLRARPLVFDLQALSASQVYALCRRGRVHLFDRKDAAKVGIEVPKATAIARPAPQELKMQSMGCASVHVVRPQPASSGVSL
ncbi:hypothetical protein [Caulobacter sp. S45]|uniref:hypothetical protein n=1 Tax=Caulobacter sp. S45 TaxID=1641861 RepID=UPI00131AF918|nr:hypothetical protein [Caulobacter sp. S45]